MKVHKSPDGAGRHEAGKNDLVKLGVGAVDDEGLPVP
jgi:hypothetical protein